MRMLRVPRNERASFRRQLKALIAAGDLLQVRGNRYGLPEKMDLVVGRLTTNPGGFGFVVPDQTAPDAARLDISLLVGGCTSARRSTSVCALTFRCRRGSRRRPNPVKWCWSRSRAGRVPHADRRGRSSKGLGALRTPAATH